jgi:hypothetical protein
MKIIENIKIQRKITANKKDVIPGKISFYITQELTYKQKLLMNELKKINIESEVIKLGEPKLISKLRTAHVIITSSYLPYAYIKHKNQVIVNTVEEGLETTDYRFFLNDIFLTNNDRTVEIIKQTKIDKIKSVKIIALENRINRNEEQSQNYEFNLYNGNGEDIVLISDANDLNNSDFVDFVKYKHKEHKIREISELNDDELKLINQNTTVYVDQLKNADFIFDHTKKIFSYKTENKKVKLIQLGENNNKMSIDEITDLIVNYIPESYDSVLIYTAMLNNVRIKNNLPIIVNYIKEKYNAVPILVDKQDITFENQVFPYIGRTGPMLKINQENAYKFEYQRLFGQLNIKAVIDFATFSSFWQDLFLNSDSNVEKLVVQNYIFDEEKSNDEKEYHKIKSNLIKFDKVLSINETIGEKNNQYAPIFEVIENTFDSNIVDVESESKKVKLILELYTKERVNFKIQQNMQKQINQFKIKYITDVFNDDQEFSELCVQRTLEHGYFSKNNQVFVVYAKIYNSNINRLIKAFIDILESIIGNRKIKLWLVVSNEEYYMKIPTKYNSNIVFFKSETFSNFYAQNAQYYINLENPTGFIENNIIFATGADKNIINISSKPLTQYERVLNIVVNRYIIIDEIKEIILNSD